MDYKKIEIVAIEETTPPTVIAQYEGVQYRVIDIDSNSRLEGESYTEFKIRRKFLEWAEKKRKQFPQNVWPSINREDLAKGKIDTTMGTFNRAKFKIDVERAIELMKKEKEKEAMDKLNEIQENNPEVTYETINTENNG